MKRSHLFVATHHKSGTVWLLTTFRRIAKANGFPFIHLNTDEVGWDIREDKSAYFEDQRRIAELEYGNRPAVFVDYHSAMPDLSRCVKERGANGLHLVRDPRDMLISAVRHHLVSKEIWLHQAKKEYGGLTYQQRITSYDKFEDQIQLELDTHMGQVIRDMADFDHQGVFVDVRYEDLIVDVEMKQFRTLMVGLGLAGDELTASLDAFWRSSLFGDRSLEEKRTTHRHIFDGRVQQWQSGVDAHVIELIEDALGDEIVKLGYRLSTELSGSS